MLFADMGQYHDVIALLLAHWARPPRTKAARCDLHNAAQKLNWPFFFLGVDKGEPHRLWPAKKMVAFFNTSPLADIVTLNEGGHISDLPLLRWNEIPSLPTSDEIITATYTPAEEGDGWPILVVQTHVPDADLPEKPARGRYYFEQNKFFGVL